MEGHCSTGQSPQWAVVPMEEEVHNALKFNGLQFFPNKWYAKHSIQYPYCKETHIPYTKQLNASIQGPNVLYMFCKLNASVVTVTDYNVVKDMIYIKIQSSSCGGFTCCLDKSSINSKTWPIGLGRPSSPITPGCTMPSLFRKSKISLSHTYLSNVFQTWSE
jgi:hypothetical protein